ncbi:MAG: excinuclease ABC subunit UvrA [Saprospiraceae bacterium]|jgi:excinuclease ABC subunit A|nr:excinuclease ABC subunit UvrA [Saprospiraceae bacterium]
MTGEELTKNFIHIKGARLNNLRDLEVFIPKHKLVAVVGLSGSGKSSLIMDTLYAEGQRRYVESLSSYARQFLDRMKKPEVDFIKGICPAIAIEQKVSTSNARSTVGSLTEIYDYLRLLYARIGKTYSPISGELVKKHSVSDVVDYIFSQTEGTKVQLLIPLQSRHERTVEQETTLLLQKGYSRVIFQKELMAIEDVMAHKSFKGKQTTTNHKMEIRVLIDRFVVTDDEENRKRIADSVLTAFSESEGECYVQAGQKKEVYFNNRFELDGMEFLEPSHQLFNYNNPYGACPRCEGYGRMLGIDPEKVIPDESLSLFEEAVACWRGEKGKEWLNQLVKNAHKFDFPIHKPFRQLTAAQQKLVWEGNAYFEGINDFFADLESKTYKIQNRVILARYRGNTTCSECKGGRLRIETTYIKVADKHIGELINMPIDELKSFFQKMKLSAHDAKLAERILTEVNGRLQTMMEVGLGYLTLNRVSSTLSGGETQRINLTRTLGSNLTQSLYILDEPSVGLHPKDTENLVKVLKRLRDLGNTVVVVEHEEEVIRNADYIIEIGPLAGSHGGELVFAGPYKEFLKNKSLTAQYLTGKQEIPVPKHRRAAVNKLSLVGCRQHNLKDVNVDIPLQAMTAVSGVSGSGKTTLVKHILYPALLKAKGEAIPASPGKHDQLVGDLKMIAGIEMINQAPIGKSSRSNPVTYVKAYDSIRKMFSDQPLSKVRGFDPKHFSFNVEGGRCETCKGDGNITVEMQFLADINLVCEECKGQRFKSEVLEVRYNELNINDVLNLTVEEAMTFFAKKKDIIAKLQPLLDVGLGYVKLGQSSSTLSGGEAQRVKLASFLSKDFTGKNIFFIFDEPTTGLHFHDVRKLLDALNALVENGHTVLIVEHNLEVIKSADWLIDLGPTGGMEGGHLLYQGKPEGIVKVKKSFTAQYLKDKF